MAILPACRIGQLRGTCQHARCQSTTQSDKHAWALEAPTVNGGTRSLNVENRLNQAQCDAPLLSLLAEKVPADPITQQQSTQKVALA